MIVVSFDKELREAFEAGQMAGMARFIPHRAGKGWANFAAAIPQTYDEWIESKRNDPQVMIG